LAIEPAQRDIFAGRLAARASAAAPLPALPTATSPEAAVAPQPPPLALRYMGSMINPDGQRLVYLAHGDLSLLVAVGDRLDEGYVVESISTDSITLVYPPLGSKSTVPIPPAHEPAP
jgi:hypothetical protein